MIPHYLRSEPVMLLEHRIPTTIYIFYVGKHGGRYELLSLHWKLCALYFIIIMNSQNLPPLAASRLGITPPCFVLKFGWESKRKVANNYGKLCTSLDPRPLFEEERPGIEASAKLAPVWKQAINAPTVCQVSWGTAKTALPNLLPAWMFQSYST